MYVVLFFFKQKTAYEMRISDWSSDVCSSDLWPSERSRNYWRLITRGSGSTSRVRGGALRRRLPKVTKGPQADGEQEQLSAGGDNGAGAAGRHRHLHRVDGARQRQRPEGI